MKVSLLSCVLAIAIALFVPGTGSSQDISPSRLHTVATGIDNAWISFAANSIVKEDGASRQYSLVHLKGNVEIRTCCLQRTQVVSASPSPQRAYMIMSADEADYDGETGKIEARGVVHISFQNAH